jgi:hypothetical protein
MADVDPDLLLRNIRNAIGLGHPAIAQLTMATLDEHLSKGGQLPQDWRNARKPPPPPYEPPQWLNDCIEYHIDTYGRPPSTADIMAWKEAEASCRMEREG